MNIPDIEGFPLGSALKVLADARDDRLSILVTGPPRVKERNIDDNYRVIRVRAVGEDELELTVCDPEAK